MLIKRFIIIIIIIIIKLKEKTVLRQCWNIVKLVERLLISLKLLLE